MKKLKKSLLASLALSLSCAVLPAFGSTTDASVGDTYYVDVAVSTQWTTNGRHLARDIDAPSLSNPVDLRQWNANMEDSEVRRWLTGKLETQAVYGSKVVVLQEAGDWVQVAVEGQPTPRHNLGYPGWMPKAQLTDDDRLDGMADKPFIMVTSNTAWLYDGRALNDPFMEISFNTRLPVMKDFGDVVMVATPDDGNKFISKEDVAVYQTEADFPEATPEKLIETAKQFLGLRYLWAGVSGFGFDCSGFTHTIHKAYGITIPRDSSVQAKHGKEIEKDAIEPGDLLFFARNNGTGSVHHVSMYIGDGLMIHAPNASKNVEIIPLDTPGYINEFSGARRYWEQ
ncbi:C40 family peptidase [Ammoniphilus sp. CFH 90114]|uniref:C40 family peptidase n=1 Tax=Ammoniphilus sp. CFH 90114 TaxID=2493665 RepID=UPI00100EBFFF|nr:C40 family peptidase [Ammoniphilus sp. CFH 90114]RXT04317.1 NlpC/P60 family protein [Ammoniphilus sp. CFH 90114]